MRDTGDYFLEQLQAIARDSSRVREARGRGLLLGLELHEAARPLAEAGLERGFLLNLVQGNILRFLPAFLLQRSHVDQTCDLLTELLRAPQEEDSVSQAQLVTATA